MVSSEVYSFKLILKYVYLTCAFIQLCDLLKYFCLLFNNIIEKLWPVLTEETQTVLVPELIHMICNLRYIFTLNIFSIIIATKASRHLKYNDLMSTEELISQKKRKLRKLNPISVGRTLIDFRFLLYYVLCYVPARTQTKEMRLNLILQRDEFSELNYKVQKVTVNRVLISVVLCMTHSVFEIYSGSCKT